MKNYLGLFGAMMAMGGMDGGFPSFGQVKRNEPNLGGHFVEPKNFRTFIIDGEPVRAATKKAAIKKAKKHEKENN